MNISLGGFTLWKDFSKKNQVWNYFKTFEIDSFSICVEEQVLKWDARWNRSTREVLNVYDGCTFCSLKPYLLWIFTQNQSKVEYLISNLHLNYTLTAKFQQKFLIFRSGILPTAIFLTFIYFRVVRPFDTVTISRMSTFTRCPSTR